MATKAQLTAQIKQMELDRIEDDYRHDRSLCRQNQAEYIDREGCRSASIDEDMECIEKGHQYALAEWRKKWGVK